MSFYCIMLDNFVRLEGHPYVLFTPNHPSTLHFSCILYSVFFLRTNFKRRAKENRLARN